MPNQYGAIEFGNKQLEELARGALEVMSGMSLQKEDVNGNDGYAKAPGEQQPLEAIIQPADAPDEDGKNRLGGEQRQRETDQVFYGAEAGSYTGAGRRFRQETAPNTYVRASTTLLSVKSDEPALEDKDAERQREIEEVEEGELTSLPATVLTILLTILLATLLLE
jgi:hypothetical protein